MRGFIVTFLSSFAFFSAGCCESLLSAQSFPTTSSDLAFKERMNLLAEGYEPYTAQYENGICVKNCTYPGISLEKEEEISWQDTLEALAQSEKYESEQQRLSVNAQNILLGMYANCKSRNPDIPITQETPWGEPLMGHALVTSGYGPRILDGEQGFHDGIDYRAKIGTLVYAPAKGRVINAALNHGACGNMVILKHPDNTQTIYCHLNKIYVKTGDTVGAGCAFAETGATGHVDGPHLHYAMKNAAGRKINPTPYTKHNES